MTLQLRYGHWKICFLLIVLCNFGFIHMSHEDMNLFGKPGEGYYIDVQIGTPPQKFNVLVDTGSTNFAIAAAPHSNIDVFYKHSNSSSYKTDHKPVSVIYTQGFWKGELGNDLMNFPSLKLLQIPCDIALIQTSHNFFMNGSQWQGILGFAYPMIVRPDPNVLSWLASVRKVYNDSMRPVFSLELCGSKPQVNHHNGRLSVGEEVRITDKLVTTPIIKEWFYEVMLIDVIVGDTPVNLPCGEFNVDKTIVDSGTTNLRFPDTVFSAVVHLIRTAVSNHEKEFPKEFWTKQKKMCWNEELVWTQMPNISLQLRHTTNSFFTLQMTSESYIRMVHDNERNQHQFCYKFAIESSDSGSVLGVVVLEGFHVVFNQTGKTVGFEKSNCGPPVSICGPFNTDKDLTCCGNVLKLPNLSALTIITYIIACLLCTCSTVTVCCFMKWFCTIVWTNKIPPRTSQRSYMIREF